MGRIADTSTNTNYNDIDIDIDIDIYDIADEIKAKMLQAKKNGFTHTYVWVNSNTDWRWFATNEARAIRGRIELVADNESTYDIKKAVTAEAKGWLDDKVDIETIDNYLDSLM